MRCENDFFGNSEKECNLEAAFDSWLVSHPKNPLSLDRIPGDSLRIVARPLDGVVPDYAGTLPTSMDPAPTGAPQKEIKENGMLKICFSETPSEERWILHGRLAAPSVRELRTTWKKNHRRDTQRDCIVDLNEVTFIDKSGMRLLRMLAREGAQFTASGIYTKHVIEQLNARRKSGVSNLLGGLFAGFLPILLSLLISAPAAKAQNQPVNGSVPSGPASDQIIRLTLRDAVNMALKYNLGTIESGENTQIARGQRLLALSNLLPQVSAGASENVQQVNLATFGFNKLKFQGIPTVVGPFSYSSVDASISQTLFSFESIQRFRAARTAEQAAQLSYQDILDVVTLTVGNGITDYYVWRWIFYINVPVGALAVVLVYQLLQDPPHLSRIKKGAAQFDYIGFSLLAIGVAALQVVLDKGQEDDWFGSHFITTLIVVAAVGLVSLVIWEWFHKDPIVDVRLFKNFNFASINVMFFAFGFLLLSGVVLLPQFLQTLMGYTAYKAGLVLSLAAFLLLFLMPLVGRLTTKFQARHLLAFGWITMAVGMYISSKRLDLLISFSAATWMRVWQFLPVAFLMVPLTMAGYVGLPPEKANAAAGLMNFMRNIGMSVGTSAVTTLVVRRSQYHQSVLAEHTRSGRFQAAIEAMTTRVSHAGFSAHDAQRQALGRLYGMLQRQASALSYVEVYWVLAVIAAVMFLGSFLLKRNEPGKGGYVAAH